MGKAHRLLITFRDVSLHFHSHSIGENQFQGPPTGKGIGNVPRRKRRHMDISEQSE